MTTVAAGRQSEARPFALAALLALTAAVAMTFLVRPPFSLRAAGDLLDWTICAATSAAPGRPTTTTTVVGSEPLAADAQKRITSMVVDFPPNAFTPEHHHEADLYVYVLQGTIRSQLGGQGVMTYTAGQSFFEPDGSTHLFAENASATEPAKILAVFIHRDGARLLVFH